MIANLCTHSGPEPLLPPRGDSSLAATVIAAAAAALAPLDLLDVAARLLLVAALATSLLVRTIVGTATATTTVMTVETATALAAPTLGTLNPGFSWGGDNTDALSDRDRDAKDDRDDRDRRDNGTNGDDRKGMTLCFRSGPAW